jgi:AcrR family transcriptional regulator
VTQATRQRERPKQRMRAEDRRDAIVAAALEVFAAGGYEASLDEVAERAGISKALIYEHFASKKELHAALLEQNLGELLDRVIAATAAANTPEGRLRTGTEAFFAFVEERREAWRMLFRNTGDPELAASLARLQEEAASAVAELVARDAPPESPIEGESLEVAVEMIAHQLVGAGQALANWWDEHRDVPREDVLQAMMDVAWLGLERLAAGERWR